MSDNGDNNSIARLSPSQGRYSSANILAQSSSSNHSTLSPVSIRNPPLHAMGMSPPHSPRIPSHTSHHTRTPSFSSTVNVVDLLASQTSNGAKPVARDWTKITAKELVQGQKLVFLDGDTPVEE